MKSLFKKVVLSSLFIPLSSYALWTWDDCTHLCSNWNYSICGNIALSGGYRCDKITADVHSFSAPDVFLGTDKLSINDISIYEIGAKGRAYLGDFYLRGYVYTGWGSDGHYHEHGTNNFDQPSFRSRAHLRHTRTFDTLVGFGYLFTFDDCWNNAWGIAPVGGWSYAQQRVKLSHGETDEIEDPIFDGLVYKNRWSGPWLGFDVQYQICEFTLFAGYEYHWTHWHAEWLLDGEDVQPTAFSDRRRSKDAYGNVVYIDGYWNFSCNWEVGLGFRFQEYCVRHGSLRPVAGLEAAGLPETERDRVKHATWCSSEVTLNLGYIF